MAESILDRLRRGVTGEPAPAAQPAVAETLPSQSGLPARPSRQSRQPNVQRLTPEQRQAKLQGLRGGSPVTADSPAEAITPDSPGPGMPAAIPATATADTPGPGMPDTIPLPRQIDSVDELRARLPAPNMTLANRNRNAFIAQSVPQQGQPVIGRFTTQQPQGPLPMGIPPAQVQAPPGTNQGQLLPPGINVPYFGATPEQVADANQALARRGAVQELLANAAQGQALYEQSMAARPAPPGGDMLGQMQAEQFGNIPQRVTAGPGAPIRDQVQALGGTPPEASVSSPYARPTEPAAGQQPAGQQPAGQQPAGQQPAGQPATPAAPQGAYARPVEPPASGTPPAAGGQITTSGQVPPGVTQLPPMTIDINRPGGGYARIDDAVGSQPSVLEGAGGPSASPNFSVMQYERGGGPALGMQNVYDRGTNQLIDQSTTPGDFLNTIRGYSQYSPGGPIFEQTAPGMSQLSPQARAELAPVFDARANQLAALQAQIEAKGGPMTMNPFVSQAEFNEGLGGLSARRANALANLRQAGVAEQRLGLDARAGQAEAQQQAAEQQWEREKFAQELPLEAQKAEADTQRAEAAMYRARNPSRPYSVLPTTAVSRLDNLTALTDQVGRIYEAFRDDYADGPFLTKWANAINERFGVGDPGQTTWWKSYNELMNSIRNELYGAALTKTEWNAFNAANITESTTPELIKVNLAKRYLLTMKGLQRMAGSFVGGNYDPGQVLPLVGGEAGWNRIQSFNTAAFAEQLRNRGYTPDQIRDVVGVVDDEGFEQQQAAAAGQAGVGSSGAVPGREASGGGTNLQPAVDPQKASEHIRRWKEARGGEGNYTREEVEAEFNRAREAGEFTPDEG